MTIRDAGTGDREALEQLWRAYEDEVPEPAWVDVDGDEESRELAEIVAREVAVVAEDDEGAIVGFALARRVNPRLGRITDVYVVRAARGSGTATLLVRRVVERLRALGVETVRLEVAAGNAHARAIYARWGFREEELTLVAPLDALAQRIVGAGGGASLGTAYVQTDDRAAVERAVRAFAPRIGSH